MTINHVREIHRVSSLPYFKAYEQWTKHLGKCSQCAHAMQVRSVEVGDYCSKGQRLQTSIQWDIDATVQAAQYN